MDELDGFYELARTRTRANSLLRSYAALLPFIHARRLTADLRPGRGRLKRLSDEIAPVVAFLTEYAAPDDEVQFGLDSAVPDCNVWHRAAGWCRTVEITVIQARERLNLMTELNETGWGRGYRRGR